MVIGNGFFSDTKDDALREMTQRSGCEVRHLPFPTIGNGLSRTAMVFRMATLGGKTDRPSVEQDQRRQSPSAGARL